MATALKDLEVLQAAETIADEIWRLTLGWNRYARDVVGRQWARAADSVGANISEAFGRYHYGEKLSFLYYARGSLYETKYWLNRAQARALLDQESAGRLAARLEHVARRLNAFAASIRSQRGKKRPSSPTATREPEPDYSVEPDDAFLFDDSELTWLARTPGPNLQSPISDL